MVRLLKGDRPQRLEWLDFTAVFISYVVPETMLVGSTSPRQNDREELDRSDGWIAMSENKRAETRSASWLEYGAMTGLCMLSA